MIVNRKLRDIILLILAMPKTIIFNFKYFPFKQAIKLPVFISHRVWLMQLGGRVEIVGAPIHRGMITIGFGRVGIFDRHNSRSIWQVAGKVVFQGRAHIGHGSKFSVGGLLILGDGFTISAESTIVATTKVEIGSGVLFSWDILLADTDFHAINDETGNRINNNAPVAIGDNVWVGCRSMILKGSQVQTGTIVAAGTTITSSSSFENNAIVGGDPVRVLKRNAFWHL